MERAISYSEMQTWSQCRRKWGFAYEEGLKPVGLIDSPTLGTFGHIAIAAHFRRESWKEALRQAYQKEIEKAQKNYIFGEINLEILENVKDILLDVFPKYLKLWEGVKWEPIEVELPFDIQTENGRIHGRIDAIIRGEDRNLYVVDHKFSANFIQQEDLILNPQIALYHYAAKHMGFNIAGVIYNQIKNRKETLPKFLSGIDPKTGKPKGVYRSRIFCTWDTYREFLIDHGYDVRDYLGMQLTLKDVQIADRQVVYRSPYEIDRFMDDIWPKISDILDPNHRIYRNESVMACRTCAYRELCIEDLKGGDIDQIKELNFTTRKERDTEFDSNEEESLERGGDSEGSGAD